MSAWVVEYTDQFGAWWTTLSVEEQRALTAAVELLQRRRVARRIEIDGRG